MALAEVTHHTAPRGQKTARAREEESDELYDAMGLMTPPPTRPTLGRVHRHAVEHLADLAPWVQILDAPVPQVVDCAMDFFRRLDLPVAEQVIEVPKISCSPCPLRSLDPEPQSAEQLVEVPTVLSPTRIALRIAEQIVDTPVPRGRDRRRLQGSHPRQSSTAAGVHNVDIPVRGGLRGFLPGQSSAQRTVEKLVDSSSGGLQDFHLYGVVSSLEEPVQEEEEHQDAQEEEEYEVPVLESAEWVQFRNPTGKTYYWNRRTHSTSWNPRWCGSVRGLRRAGSGTGTRAPVPAPILFLRYLLSEAPWLVWTSTTALIDAHRRYRQWHMQVWFCWFSSRCVPLRCRQALMLRIKAGMNPKDSDAS